MENPFFPQTPIPPPSNIPIPVLMLFVFAGWVHKFGMQEGEVGGSSEVEFCRGVGLFTNFQRLMFLVGIYLSGYGWLHVG